MREQLDAEATLVDTISPGAEFVEIGGRRKHVISYLRRLPVPAGARALAGDLAVGRRAQPPAAGAAVRQPANVLVLDEPTNDLDIDTLELLEELLQDFAGTLFLVSHDRAFLDNVVTQTIVFEGDGLLREYAGGFSDWMDYQSRRNAAEGCGAAAHRFPACTGRPAAARANERASPQFQRAARTGRAARTHRGAGDGNRGAARAICGP